MTSQRLRILMLTNVVAPDRIGGLERYVRELSAALVSAGASVTVHAKQIDGSHPLVERGDDGVLIRRHALPPRSNRLFAVTYPLRSGASALAGAREDRGALLHAHYPVPALPLALTRRRFLYTFHAPVHRELLSERQDSYTLPAPVQGLAVGCVRASERLIVRRAAASVVLSEFSRAELGALDSAAGARAQLVAGGVDLQRFAPGPALDDRWAAGAAPLLFCARRLTPRTGVAELLTAMVQIRSAFPGVRLAIAGAGRMQELLDAQCTALGLADCVRFLGRISDDALPRWYRAADLVILPTQELEGFGLATAEALACGTPVLGTPIGATPEILAPLERRLLTLDRSPAAIAEAVIALLRDPQTLQRVRAGARERATPLGWETVAGRYLELYEALTRSRA
jgi:glycosyltransferase involved in cell wall biosynthesis